MLITPKEVYNAAVRTAEIVGDADPLPLLPEPRRQATTTTPEDPQVKIDQAELSYSKLSSLRLQSGQRNTD